MIRLFTLLLLALFLTACSSDTVGTNSDGDVNNSGDGNNGGGGDVFTPSNTALLNLFETKVAANPKDTKIGEHTSLAAIADEIIILQGLTVGLYDSTDYTRGATSTAWTDTANLQIAREITPLRITESAVSLAFGGAGVMTSATAYADSDIANVAADRNSVFGFNSDNMVYISWGVNQTTENLASGETTGTLTNIDGMMIAGIETASIIGAGRVDFTGKGAGVYGTKTGNIASSQNVTFGVTAAVDFTDRDVIISTDNDDDSLDSTLNFTTAAINYGGSNLINYSFDGSTEQPAVNGMLGQLDARFYGGGTEEFGGTFILTQADTGYYYGAFGASRKGVTPFVAGTVPLALNRLGMVASKNPQTTDVKGNDSLGTVAGEAVILQGLTVGLNDSTEYRREKTNALWTTEANLQITQGLTATHITSSAASLTFGAAGTITSAIAYADEDYANLTADRSAVFGFTSEYMAYITWDTDESLNIDDNTALTQTVTDSNGMMIAGIENNVINIFTAGRVDFKGKGAGVYGTKTDKHKTEFNVTIAADFDESMLNITTSETACTDNCTQFNAPPYLNFSTGLFSYTDNNISTNLTLDGTLTGTLDAKFYGSNAQATGGGAQEFGGAFALAQEDTRYYYGVFGASRNGVVPFVPSDTTTFNALGTVTNANTQNTNIGTHTSLATVATDTVILQGLAVGLQDATIHTRYKDDAWTDSASEFQSVRTINASRITSSAASLTFGATAGTITSATAYADADYATATANRSIGNFTANHLVLVEWGQDESFSSNASGETQTITDIDGMMIAGIETTSVPTGAGNGKATFMGRGKGVYGNITLSDAVTFDVEAEVVFTNNTISFKAENTACDVGTTCATGVTASDLNFAISSLIYTGNNITTSLTNIDGMNGQLDARFYGNSQAFESDGSVTGANELGGTFLVGNADNYYYGAFASARGAIDFTFNSGDTKAINTNVGDITVASTPPNSVATTGIIDSTNSTLQGLAVSLDDSTKYLRPNAQTNSNWNLNDTNNLNINRVFAVSQTASTGTMPAVSLTFTAGAITGFTAYADAEYTGTTVDRKDIFGFANNSSYMAYVTWTQNETFNASVTGVEQNVTNIDGMMIAGIETGAMLSDGKVDFTGKGKGAYGTNDGTSITDYDVSFNVTAAVDFKQGNVNIITDSTSCTANCNSVTLAPDYLNFTTGAFSYGSNDGTTDLTLNNPQVNTNLVGDIDVRFYGNDADDEGLIGSNEFGGTFALANATNYYYGAFGANRGDVFVSSSTSAINAVGVISMDADNPVTTIPSATTLTGNLTLKGLALSLDDEATYTRYKKTSAWMDATETQIARAITLNRVTKSGALIDFATGTATTIYADADYTVSDANVTATIDRDTIFGFATDSNYMAYVEWAQTETVANLDSGNTLSEDSFTNIDGMMIAGLETGSIIGDGKVDFSGKGKGVYGTTAGGAVTVYDVAFGVAVAANFTAGNVTVVTDTTTCIANCNGNTAPNYLNFNTGAFSYGSNNGTTNLALNNPLTGNNIAGTLDVRFYGGGTEEFGGAFALSSANNYYYGAFGASRAGHDLFQGSDITTLNALGTVVATSTVNPSTATTLTGSLTLQGLAVSLNSADEYTRYKDDAWNVTLAELQIDRQVTPNRVTDSGVAIDFTGDTVTTIHADTNYTVSDANVTATVDRDTIFGFASDSNYMAYISWSKDESFNSSASGEMQTVTDIDGMMIAGIETASIIGAGRVDFIGKGKGVYGTKTESFDTVFSVTAKVDFDERDMLLSTTTEACTNCNNFDVSRLDFTNLSLGFESAGASVNSISQAVTLDTTLTGTLDARFYGGGTEEFGGTFALAQADIGTIDGRYYYGAFGASRNGVTPFEPSDTTTIDALNTTSNANPQSTDIGTHTRLSAVAADTVTVQGLAVGLKDATIHTRYKDDLWTVDASEFQTGRTLTASRITGASASLTFGSAGTVTSAIAYVDADYATATANRNIGGSNYNYLTLVEWGQDESFGTANMALTQTVTDIDGMMIVGIETADLTIFSGSTTFTGKGKGVYGTKTGNVASSYETSFTARAIVNFDTDRVNITTTSTSCTDNCSGVTVPSYLNFTIDYFDYDGNSKAVTLDNTLTGTLDTRFYGDVVQEFGGAFAFAEADTRYYYGAFGAKRPSYVYSLDAPQTFNDNDLVSFDDLRRKSTVGNALKIASAVELKRSSGSNQTLSIADAIAEFNYNADDEFSSLILYLDGQRYSTTNLDASDITEDAVSDLSPDSYSGSNTPNRLQLSKSTYYFADVPEYMALINWTSESSQNINNRSYGYAMVGYETDGDDIPSAGDITFTGEGHGIYYTGSDFEDIRFTATAIVNFATPSIAFSTTDTCLAFTSCSDTRSFLNIDTTLSYTAGTKDISGAVTAVGDGGQLTGTVSARFYGDSAQEFGGTFSLLNSGADTDYVGFFGANRVFVPEFDKPTDFNHNGLTSFTDDARNGTSNNAFKIAGLVAMKDTASEARSISTSTDAVLELSYELDGDFAATNGMALYWGDDRYRALRANTSNSTADVLRPYSTDKTAGGNIGVMKIDKSSILFDFDSENMAVFGLSLTDSGDSYNIYGMTGFETADDNIPTLDNGFFFTGNGEGKYGRYVSGLGYSDSIPTYFEVTAHVDFISRNITVTGENTCASGNYYSSYDDCVASANLFSQLDFTATLSYNAGDNDITGAIQTSGSNSTFDRVSGTATARFYGIGTDAATELGGTFSMVSTTGSVAEQDTYIGWFGVDAGTFPLLVDIDANTIGTSAGGTHAISTNYGSVATASAGANTMNVPAYKLKALTVQTVKSNTYTRPDTATAWDVTSHKTGEHVQLSKVSGSVLEIKYGQHQWDADKVAISQIKTYVGTTTNVSFFASTSNTPYDLTGQIQSAQSDGRSSRLTLIHDVDPDYSDTLQTEYVALVAWNEDLALPALSTTALTDSRAYEDRGYMVAGVETAGTAIPGSGTAVGFTGGGVGTYEASDSPLLKSTHVFKTRVVFDLDVEVNFVGKKVDITFENTRQDLGSPAIGAIPHLDFTSELSYTANMNNASSTVTVDGMVGEVNARFYGPTAQELGGTFHMSKSKYDYYMGHFGAKKD